jgi:hypothetical protein
MSIAKRLRAVIESETNNRIRYVELEQMTGISGSVWKNFWFGRRTPDAEMLESIARQWPQYAFWLSTGATDFAFGHICPKSEMNLENKKTILNFQGITDEPYFKESVEATKHIEDLLDTGDEEVDCELAVLLNNFLLGNAIHRFDEKTMPFYMMFDASMKKIKLVRQTGALRIKEKTAKFAAV